MEQRKISDTRWQINGLTSEGLDFKLFVDFDLYTNNPVRFSGWYNSTEFNERDDSSVFSFDVPLESYLPDPIASVKWWRQPTEDDDAWW